MADIKNPASEKLSEEQTRLSAQIEIIRHDVEVRPFGQPLKRGYEGVDKKTGEVIDSRNVAARKDDLLRGGEKSRMLSLEESIMLKEGWGRVVQVQPEDRTWKINANIGIRTRGDDALNIVLVETKGNAALSGTDRYGQRRSGGEDRRWEYHISRKGQDATKPENVLKVPVFSNFGMGLLADIGNKGSSYTSKDVTTKNFQSQKVLRNADDIEITVPPPAGMGVALAVLNRDPFKAFAAKKAIRGGSIIVPDDSIDHVTRGIGTTCVQLKAAGEDNWGEVLFEGGVGMKELTEIKSSNVDNIYSNPPIPQDELLWKEASDKTGKKLERMSVIPIDGSSSIPEGSTVVMAGNTGAGPSLKVDGKDYKVPPHSYEGNVNEAWNSPPVWLHGPGNKGKIDISGLDGRVVIAGGGTLVTSQNPMGTWWYSDVILAGGTKDNKAIYTIEVPQFMDPKHKINVAAIPGNRHLHIHRNPMQPYKEIPLSYPDGSKVEMSHTENDTISIKGDHIEVRIKEGDEIRTLYDSDKPELSQQSSLEKRGGGALLAAAMASEAANTSVTATRRQFLGASVAAVTTAFQGGAVNEEKQERGDFVIKESRINALDPATSSLEQLMPDVVLKPNGRAMVHSSYATMAQAKSASRG
jgi:hypothetical protein